MNDHYGNDIEVGDDLVYTDESGNRYIGTVEYDPNYRGGMRVGGRSICDILDHCPDVRAYAT